MFPRVGDDELNFALLSCCDTQFEDGDGTYYECRSLTNKCVSEWIWSYLFEAVRARLQLILMLIFNYTVTISVLMFGTMDVPILYVLERLLLFFQWVDNVLIRHRLTNIEKKIAI